MPDVLTALDAFVQEHRRCGELDGVERGARLDGLHCGAHIAHPASPAEPTWPDR